MEKAEKDKTDKAAAEDRLIDDCRLGASSALKLPTLDSFFLIIPKKWNKDTHQKPRKSQFFRHGGGGGGSSIGSPTCLRV